MAGGVLVYLCVVVPIIEEAVKALVVAFADPKRTRSADALLWGIAAGAGFAAMENVFNAGAVLSAWIFVILMRFGATVMYVANGATMGLGWYAARTEGRWSKLAIAYCVSVVIHAIWNMAAVVMGGSALFLSGKTDAGQSALLSGSVLIVALFSVMILLSLLGIVWIAYSVREQEKQIVKGENA